MDVSREETLAVALGKALAELERLRYIHLPQYEGKLGEPSTRVIAQAKRALGIKE